VLDHGESASSSPG